MSEFGNIFPANYQLKTIFQPSQGEVYADWLMTINLELYEEIKLYDWTARMYENPIMVENIRWPS